MVDIGIPCEYTSIQNELGENNIAELISTKSQKINFGETIKLRQF